MSKGIEKEITTEKTTAEKDTSANVISSKKEKNAPRTKSAKKPVAKELDKLHKEISELKDKYLRLYSEFENYRRRTAKEKLEMVSTANEELMIELLPVIDDFERAIKAFDDNNSEIESMKEGVNLIFSKLKNVTIKKGLKLMESNPGDEFNAEIHDAITQIPAPEDELKGKIVDTIEKGYYLNDKVIRFAKVVIGS